MPYLLTAGNQPGSPASWIKTEDGQPSSAGITLPDSLMTTVTSQGPSSYQFRGNPGINKMEHLHTGSMTIGRPLPRPLPPINDSLAHSSNDLKYGGQRSKFASNSQLTNTQQTNRDFQTNNGQMNNLNFATTPRNLNLNAQSSMSHPNGLSALLNGRMGNQPANNQLDEDSSPMSQGGSSSVAQPNFSGNATLPHNAYPSGYWSSLNYQISNGVPMNHQLELQSPASNISNYSLSRNMMKNYNQNNSSARANSEMANNPNFNFNPNFGRLPEKESPPGPYHASGSLPPFSEALMPNPETTKTLGNMNLGLNSNLQSTTDQIQSHIPHQDMVDWGDNTTAITGLSDLAYPPDLMGRWGEDVSGGSGGGSSNTSNPEEDGWRFKCHRYIDSWLAGSLSVIAFLSPILMVSLPKMNIAGFKESQMICNVECDGLLLSFSFKLLILLLGTWALFFRPSKATLPRIFMFRSCVCLLLFIIVFAFWLFYGVRVLDGRGGEGQAAISAAHRKVQYVDVVHYASSMVDALLFVHYLAILLIEIRHTTTTQFCIKIVRSPDGQSRTYSIGQLSIQRAAAWVLEKYYTDFPIFNPYLESYPDGGGSVNGNKSSGHNIDVKCLRNRNNGHNSSTTGTLMSEKQKHSSNHYKYYSDISDISNGILGTIPEKDMEHLIKPSPMKSTFCNNKLKNDSHIGGGHSATGGESSTYASVMASNLCYEEYEYERRLKKRRARLVAAADDAFSQIKRLEEARQKSSSSCQPKSTLKNKTDAYEVARILFPSLARPLQKYLRITRQQPWHSMDSILKHLALCIKHECASKAFLEKYLVSGPVIQSDRERRPIQTWSLVCETQLSRSIKCGTIFQLRQGNDVSLLCQIQKLPHFNIVEELLHSSSSNRLFNFNFKNNSETPV